MDFWGNPIVQMVMVIVAFSAYYYGRLRLAQRKAKRSMATANPSLAASGALALPNAIVATPVRTRENRPTVLVNDVLSRSIPIISLSRIAQADNIAIIGPKGSGKTTLLLTILENRHGESVAFDPHDSPGKWPCQTIGKGRDYPAIRKAIMSLDRLMSERFQQLGDGEVAEGDFSRRTMVSDEFRSIATNLPGTKGQNPIKGAGDYLLDRIAEGRKVGEAALLACHNDTVEALGIQGNSDMKTCFDFFIYTGGMAVQRYRQRGNASSEAIERLQELDRQYVVWDTERDLWFILNFDLEPVFVQKTPTAPARSVIRTPLLMEEVADELYETDRRTDGQLQNAEKSLSLSGSSVRPSVRPDRESLVRFLIAEGWSKTDIRTYLRGENAKLGELVDQIMSEEI